MPPETVFCFRMSLYVANAHLTLAHLLILTLHVAWINQTFKSCSIYSNRILWSHLFFAVHVKMGTPFNKCVQNYKNCLMKNVRNIKANRPMGVAPFTFRWNSKQLVNQLETTCELSIQSNKDFREHILV